MKKTDFLEQAILAMIKGGITGSREDGATGEKFSGAYYRARDLVQEMEDTGHVFDED